jgi:hypothetical protein
LNLRPDVSEVAFRVLQEATGERPKTLPPSERTTGKNPKAVKRGRKGGKNGGKARTDALTPTQRKEAAILAANARWKKGD